MKKIKKLMIFNFIKQCSGHHDEDEDEDEDEDVD